MKLTNLLLITIVSSILYSQQPVDAVNKNTGNNVCEKSKLDLATGTQNPNGECVKTVMGEIPSKDHMVSTLIFFPQSDSEIKEKTSFTVKTKTINLDTGFFSDPKVDYYTRPQTLGKNGFVQGHSHVTIQKLDGNKVPDPRKIAFFKGLNDPAVNGGFLNVEVTGGLPAGKYRLCTMTASFTHQPTLMPIAQRGSQDDCVRFTVVKGKGKGKKRKSHH